MEFRIAEQINYPVEAVYQTYRDRLPELVPYLPNVDAIEVLEVQQTPRGPKIRNRWKVSAAIPRALRSFFSDKLMTYLDSAVWSNAELKVDWRFEIGVLPDAIDCHGTNFFYPGDGEGTTEVALTGSLVIDFGKLRGVPRILHGLAPKVESFVLGQVKPNLVAVCQAVGTYLDHHNSS